MQAFPNFWPIVCFLTLNSKSRISTLNLIKNDYLKKINHFIKKNVINETQSNSRFNFPVVHNKNGFFDNLHLCSIKLTLAKKIKGSHNPIINQSHDKYFHESVYIYILYINEIPRKYKLRFAVSLSLRMSMAKYSHVRRHATYNAENLFVESIRESGLAACLSFSLFDKSAVFRETDVKQASARVKVYLMFLTVTRAELRDKFLGKSLMENYFVPKRR